MSKRRTSTEEKKFLIASLYTNESLKLSFIGVDRYTMVRLAAGRIGHIYIRRRRLGHIFILPRGVVRRRGSKSKNKNKS